MSRQRRRHFIIHMVLTTLVTASLSVAAPMVKAMEMGTQGSMATTGQDHHHCDMHQGAVVVAADGSCPTQVDCDLECHCLFHHLYVLPATFSIGSTRPASVDLDVDSDFASYIPQLDFRPPKYTLT